MCYSLRSYTAVGTEDSALDAWDAGKMALSAGFILSSLQTLPSTSSLWYNRFLRTALVSTSAMTTTTSHQLDVQFLVKKSMTAGYQYMSLLTPPLYLAYTLSRHGRSAFSLNRMLRSTWIGGGIGSLGGGAIEYARSAYSNEDVVRRRRIDMAYDTSALRAEDHSTIGGLLFGLLTPAFLWKRARAVHLILGGAGIGSSVGLLTHWTRSLSGDRPPKVLQPSIPETLP
jgi:hypothetical protein